MKWSFKIGTFAGIGVYVHVTFFLIIVFVLMQHWLRGEGAAAAVNGVFFTLAIFLCVVLHEYGHALAARKFGIRTKDITLLPIGGVARLERMPDKPLQELWVAVAGPLVNVAIAALLVVWLVTAEILVPMEQLSVTGGPFLERMLAVNVFLVLFNMIPAFPMDGGRVLRALLASRMDYNRATQISASLGQGIAFLFGLVGIFTNPMLVFVALFVWIGAEQEASLTQMRSALGGIPVARAMVTDFRVLAPGDTLDEAVRLVLSGSQHDFPVVDREQVVGVLTRGDLLKALAQAGGSARVDSVMQREFHVVDAAEMLERAFAQLQECRCHTLPVIRHGRLEGLLTMDNVGEFVAIQAALAGRARAA